MTRKRTKSPFRPTKKYNWASFRKDLIAGVIVGIVLIPQGMAYATIAGLPPILGLYGGLAPLLIYPLIGRSRSLSIGPVALDMLILSAGLGYLAGEDQAQRVQFAIYIASLTGVLQIIMGALKLGAAFNLIARPVISGFTIAAAVIIITSQIDTLLGLDVPSSQYVHEVILSLFKTIGNFHFETLISSCAFILLLIVFRKWIKHVPASVLVMGLTLLSLIFIAPSQIGIKEIGAIPEGLPNIDWDHIKPKKIRDVFSTALTLCFVQFMTIASLSKIYARKGGYTTDPNRELVALGSANFVGGFFQSPPVSASFSRSAIANEVGARSTGFNLFSAGLIVLTLLFLTPVFEQLPRNLLGSIILVSVITLIDIKEIRYLFRAKRRDATIATITFLAVLFIGIREGVILGISASALAILIKLGKPTVAELGQLPGTRDFRNVKRFEEAKSFNGILILRVDASFSFINAEFFKKYILRKSLQTDAIAHVIIDGTTIGDMDITAMESLSNLIEDLNQQNIELYISGLIGPVRDILEKSENENIRDTDRYFPTLHDAVKHVLEKQDKTDAGNRLENYLSNSD